MIRIIHETGQKKKRIRRKKKNPHIIVYKHKIHTTGVQCIVTCKTNIRKSIDFLNIKADL